MCLVSSAEGWYWLVSLFPFGNVLAYSWTVTLKASCCRKAQNPFRINRIYRTLSESIPITLCIMEMASSHEQGRRGLSEFNRPKINWSSFHRTSESEQEPLSTDVMQRVFLGVPLLCSASAGSLMKEVLMSITVPSRAFCSIDWPLESGIPDV